MKLVDFIEALEEAASKYMVPLRILVRTDNAVKARVEISENIFVQFYFHQITGTTNYVLVGWERRLYGRDCVGGKWHRHPFENQNLHETTGEAGDAVTPKEFLDDVFEILLREGLV